MWARWMGANGRRTAEAAFTWDQIADTLAGHYDALPSARTSGRAA